jgi:hypothetical protein
MFIVNSKIIISLQPEMLEEQVCNKNALEQAFFVYLNFF